IDRLLRDERPRDRKREYDDCNDTWSDFHDASGGSAFAWHARSAGPALLLELLQLILGLVVVRIELHRRLEILDRARLVALGVLHLRHRLIRLRRLREVLEVRLQ